MAIINIAKIRYASICLLFGGSPRSLHPQGENLAEMMASSSNSPQPAPLFPARIKPVPQLVNNMNSNAFRLLVTE